MKRIFHSIYTLYISHLDDSEFLLLWMIWNWNKKADCHCKHFIKQKRVKCCIYVHFNRDSVWVCRLFTWKKKSLFRTWISGSHPFITFQHASSTTKKSDCNTKLAQYTPKKECIGRCVAYYHAVYNNICIAHQMLFFFYFFTFLDNSIIVNEIFYNIFNIKMSNERSICITWREKNFLHTRHTLLWKLYAEQHLNYIPLKSSSFFIFSNLQKKNNNFDCKKQVFFDLECTSHTHIWNIYKCQVDKRNYALKEN